MRNILILNTPPTLDMIAVPDFASGAMENWGAITYLAKVFY